MTAIVVGAAMAGLILPFDATVVAFVSHPRAVLHNVNVVAENAGQRTAMPRLCAKMVYVDCPDGPLLFELSGGTVEVPVRWIDGDRLLIEYDDADMNHFTIPIVIPAMQRRHAAVRWSTGVRIDLSEAPVGSSDSP
jgi:hypothetical protein